MGGTNANGQSVNVASSDVDVESDGGGFDDIPDDDPEVVGAKAAIKDARAVNKDFKEKNAQMKEANLKKKQLGKSAVNASRLLNQKRVYKSATAKAAEVKSKAEAEAAQQTPIAHPPGQGAGLPAPDTPTLYRNLASQVGQVAPATGDQEPPGEGDDL